MPHYQQAVKEVINNLKSSEKGLSSKEAKKRLNKYGPNKIGTERKISLLKLLWSQFNDPLVWVLLFAIAVSALIQHYIDAVVIAIIVVLNAGLGFFQEFKAEKAIEHLRELQQHKAKVLRNGKELEILTENLVPGDIIFVEEGDKIPADCRLIESIELQVDEASLTGESSPVTKLISTIKGKKVTGDQKNMIFTGTVVTRGRGKGIVTNTGKETELGKIAKEIETIEEEITPLQKRLKEIGKWLTIGVIIICALIFTLGWLRGFAIFDMFLITVSLAVAAIPEGLPAVVTITLALGLKKMLKRKALIRKLKSVETLGSVTVICSDKTGTLTKNEMTVTKVWANEKVYNVTGSGYEIKGDILFNKKNAANEIKNLLLTATSCNDATTLVGDPTERALKVLAAKGSVKELERKSEIPFSSDKKFMSITDVKGISYLKGATLTILSKCDKIEINGKVRKLTEKDKQAIIKQNETFSKEALRVLAYAYGTSKLTFLGLTGMIDPAREEVPKAIATCIKAGIRTLMITGDHKLTAEAVAKQVDIKGKSIEGIELDDISDKELKKLVNKTAIFARVNSLHKSRILKALQSNGEIVAMTGDGVNDAPAIKQSNVGVAMNLKGTEITKDVSDLILLDDNFATIVAAVEEGRTIYSNIRKFVKFLLAANFGEIALIAIPIFIGIASIPLSAIQLLWINLVTDSFPALALGKDPAEPNIMSKKPRDPKSSFFTDMKMFMLLATIIASSVTIGVFLWYYRLGDIEFAQTMTFCTLIMFELFLVFACRSDTVPIFKLKQNYWLYGAVALSFFTLLLLLYTPLAGVFKLSYIGLQEWIIIIPLAASGLIFFELRKLLHKAAKTT
tara:strand:+ start:3527 stop:6079 length:2553 start_codon:yes stop_codon:yes gene_type:complete